MKSLQRATSGLNVIATLLCLQIQPIMKHTHVHRTTPILHTHAQTVMYEVQWWSCTAGHIRPQEAQYWR